jgi:hypothetical protein
LTDEDDAEEVEANPRQATQVQRAKPASTLAADDFMAEADAILNS